MTLLFFLRSPAGNTDTGQSPDAGKYWNYDDADKPKRKTKAEKRAERLAKKKLDFVMEEMTKEQLKKKRKRKEEEELMMLFMHEFEGYDD